jgi:hypothetical protein
MAVTECEETPAVNVLALSPVRYACFHMSSLSSQNTPFMALLLATHGHARTCLIPPTFCSFFLLLSVIPMFIFEPVFSLKGGSSIYTLMDAHCLDDFGVL